MYSKYRPLLPQIAQEPNTKGKSTPIADVTLSNCLVLFVQVALVGAFILQTSFDKRTRVLLYTHDVLHHDPHSHWRLVSAINKHWAQSGIYRYAIAKIQIKLEIKKNFARKIVMQQKKSQNIWNFKEYIVSLQRERNLFRMGAPVGSASTH